MVIFNISFFVLSQSLWHIDSFAPRYRSGDTITNRIDIDRTSDEHTIITICTLPGYPSHTHIYIYIRISTHVSETETVIRSFLRR